MDGWGGDMMGYGCWIDWMGCDGRDCDWIGDGI